MGEQLHSFLFADLVGSTEQWDTDPASMSRALERHDTLTRAAVSDADGVVFKHSGDGFCAVFDSPLAAAIAAASIQRAVVEDPLLRLRMGIHIGPAEERDHDWFGPTLNRTARIMGLAHGGQVLLSAAAASIIDAAHGTNLEAVRLGEVSLRGLTESEIVHQLVAPGLAQDFPTLAGQALDTLPRPRTSFLGRAEEVGTLVRLLGEHRLVSITGIGGTGKTRLAIEVARKLFHHLADGVLFVSLSEVDGAEGVIPALTEAAGITLAAEHGKPGSPEAEARLFKALSDRDVLVVLDNCEHLLDPVAALVDEILDRCPVIRVLTTSREPLGVADERVWRVPALDDDTAVALLVDRARYLDADFTLTEGDRKTAIELCRRLDRLPLALELAAARFGAMTVGEVASRLDDRFRLLAGRGRRHDRHATLRATLDWSYDLLTSTEQLVLERTSVFVGGFDLDAAERVAGATPLEADFVDDAVGALVAKSLLVAVNRDGRRRFDLLETVRAYAGDHLAAHGATDTIRVHHARWCQERSMQYWNALGDRAGVDADEAFSTEADNIRAAHTWAVEQEDVDTALWTAGSLAQVWHLRGLAAEGRRRAETSLALIGGDRNARRLCTLATAQCAKWTGDLEGAWTHTLTALNDIGDVAGTISTFAWATAADIRLGLPDHYPGPNQRECLDRYRSASSNPVDRRHADFLEGTSLVLDGRADEAIGLLIRSAPPDGDFLSRYEWWRACFLAVARYVVDGNLELPADLDDHTLHLADPNALATAETLRALQRAASGKPVANQVAAALHIIRRAGMRVTLCGDGLAGIALAVGDHRKAVTLLGGQFGHPRLGLHVLVEPAARRTLGDEEYDRLVAEGAALSEEQFELLARSIL